MKHINKVWKSPYMTASLLFCVIILVILNFFRLSIFPTGPVDPAVVGTLGDWISGLIAAIALIVSAETLRISNTQIEALEREKLHEKKLLLSNLFSWIESVKDVATEKQINLKLILINKTSTPIYKWTVEIEAHPECSIDHLTFGPIFPDRTEIPLTALFTKIGYQKEVPKTKIIFQNAHGDIITRDTMGNIII